MFNKCKKPYRIYLNHDFPNDIRLIDNEISRGKLDFRIIKKLNASQENKFSETRVLQAVKALKKISKLSGQDFSSSPTEIESMVA